MAPVATNKHEKYEMKPTWPRYCLNTCGRAGQKGVRARVRVRTTDPSA